MSSSSSSPNMVLKLLLWLLFAAGFVLVVAGCCILCFIWNLETVVTHPGQTHEGFSLLNNLLWRITVQ